MFYKFINSTKLNSRTNCFCCFFLCFFYSVILCDPNTKDHLVKLKEKKTKTLRDIKKINGYKERKKTNGYKERKKKPKNVFIVFINDYK